MSVRLSRRTVLKAAGGLAFALPLFTSLRARAGGLPPKRLVIFFHPNGVFPDQWYPTPGADPHAFTLGQSLAVLEPFREHLLITSGIDLKVTTSGPGGPHQKAMGGLLTGRKLLNGNFVGGDGSLAGWASGMSVDQRVAQEIGAGTRFGSLLLGVRSGGGEVRDHLSYAGPNQPLPVQKDPRLAWDAIFSDFDAPSPELARIRARRGSVLDAVREQLGLARKQLPADERIQLDRHLAMVQDLELRLAATTNADLCERPPEPPAMEPDSASTMPDVARLQIDLLVMALACDLTRVGLIQNSTAQNHIPFPWVNSPEDGHALSHLGNSDPARPHIALRDAWYAERFAYLLKRLRAIPEGDGTMLDHTLIWWVNELAVGNTHSQRNMPFLFAGGATGWELGRYVRFDGASHSDLLLSILHGFGIPVDTFGDPEFESGPLPL